MGVPIRAVAGPLFFAGGGWRDGGRLKAVEQVSKQNERDLKDQTVLSLTRGFCRHCGGGESTQQNALHPHPPPLSTKRCQEPTTLAGRTSSATWVYFHGRRLATMVGVAATTPRSGPYWCRYRCAGRPPQGVERSEEASTPIPPPGEGWRDIPQM